MQNANVKAFQVVVDDSDYRASHQKAPRGTGLWLYCTVNPRHFSDYLERMLVADYGSFAYTKNRARSLAAARGLRVIYVCA